MTRKKKDRIRERDVGGLKHLEKLLPLLERLHDAGCERDKAGNRELHFDQYCLLILLYLFNPIVTSLRAIQQASELNKVQRLLGCPRAALGSLSEVATVFDLRYEASISLGNAEIRVPSTSVSFSRMSVSRLSRASGWSWFPSSAMISLSRSMTWAVWISL